jgi:glycosyltransferase involved in cell wall biosynthesis
VKARRLDQLIDAAAFLLKEGHPLDILLVGDGPDMAGLKSQAARLGVSLRCVGACYDESMLCKYTMIAAATASPGMVGLTAIQSLAYGTPVITHGDFDRQGPEVEAINPGVSGDFFAHGDVADLARVLRKWTASPRPSPETQRQCIGCIEDRYTPEFQVRIIDAAVSCVPASELPHQEAMWKSCCGA